MNELAPGMIQKIQIAAGLAVVAIYIPELWWQRENWWCEDYEKLINRQERVITGILRCAPRQ